MTMKALPSLFAIVIGMQSLHVAAADGVDSRPAGVEERNWVAITDKLGFVVADAVPSGAPAGSRQVLLAPPESISPALAPPTKGYFVLKTPLGWRRVTISEPSELTG